MSSLTHTAYVARKAIKFSVVAFFGYILLQYSVIYGWQLYLYLYPPPPPPPTMGFGPLPAIEFVDNPGYDYDFTLQLPSSAFPFFSDRASVYYMPYQRANLLALDQAKRLATQIGFVSEPVALTTQLYEWRVNLPSPFVLTNNIIDGSFELTYQWQTDPSLLTTKQLSGKDESLQYVRTYMGQIGQAPQDIAFQEGFIRYQRASGNRLIDAVSLSEADFIRIDYFRSPIIEPNVDPTLPPAEPKAVLTANPEKGILTVILSGSQDELKRIVSIDYDYFPVNYLTAETYPLKPVALAWEELKQGEGYMAKTEGNSKSISIRRIRLGYYDSPQAQQYLQPIYIFSGDDGGNNEFIAYVRAVDKSMIRSQ